MRDIDFCELLRRGEISRLPRLFAVQPENCAPLHARPAAPSWQSSSITHHRGRRYDHEAGAHARGTRGGTPVGRESSGRVAKGH